MPFQSSGKQVGALRPPVAGPRAVREHPAVLLDCDLELVALKETKFYLNRLI
jgi:hypothetical protein